MLVRDKRDNEKFEAVVKVLECNGKNVFQIWSSGRKVDKPLSSMFEVLEHLQLAESFEVVPLMQVEAFEGALQDWLEEEYGSNEITCSEGVYDIAYTTDETEQQEYTLKYNFNLNILIWAIDGVVQAVEDWSPEELIENLEFDLIFNHCYSLEA